MSRHYGELIILRVALMSIRALSDAAAKCFPLDAITQKATANKLTIKSDTRIAVKCGSARVTLKKDRTKRSNDSELGLEGAFFVNKAASLHWEG
jgi:hypothetical protein